MKPSALIVTACLSLAASLLLASCGAKNSDGTLQFITLTPAAATTPATGGTVQFVATGHYANPTHDVTPLRVEAPMKAGWSYTASQGVTITLTQDGTASCGSATGKIVVSAWALPTPDGPVCNVIAPGGAPCSSIAGTAQLTCK